jgi:hypothetical protein
MYLNEIALASDHEFTGDAIRESVSYVEALLCEEILNAYEPVWPEAWDACTKLLPNLEIVNSYGNLRDVFEDIKWESDRNRHEYGLDRFIKMLVEIGILGKVIQSREGYVIGLFEYRCPLRLHTKKADTFCVHPLFMQTYGVVEPRSDQEVRLVYPFGSHFKPEDIAHLRLGALQD